MPTQGGLINTTPLAIQYDRALQDPYEDSTIGLWNRLLNAYFDNNSWIVTPQKCQETNTRPDFVIERFWANNSFIEVIIIKAKPQQQTMRQDHQTDEQVLSYTLNALHSGQQKGQRKIYALRVVGVYIMAYKVSINQPSLTPMASDYMNPKQHVVAILQIFNTIKAANVLVP
ncbi:predicted protein [Histoplasma capsulatum G186AR]|uniref:Fungal-type protein kinase domain-containing protein n=2 Tax=Ajellomyces capsulatus TaxID=5037 RepID=C0NPU0_AJECG|nr:uncharacterized protein HCBG_05170 [Histoplasma capsulatum G186AR]EEH06950.1 predicted protein [Histoplasma capsulatum G186AR]KAG5294020.1 hypothetical protein I7I52_05524 [Histoplasma capsulatum]QSS75472.1 hypothetical protein I7I50_04615 [Histoplasma capsulatum G186AR]